MSRKPDLEHAATPQWMGFELRMRRRRLAQCLLRADLALGDSRVEDARAALDEARELEPDAPELAALTQRLKEAGEVVVRRPGVWSLAAGLLAVILVASALLAARFWPGTAETPADPVAHAAGAAAPPAAAEPSRSRAAVRIDQETIAAPQVRPRVVEDEQLSPPRLAPPIAQARPPRQIESTTAAARHVTSRAPSAPAPSPPASPRAEAGVEPAPAPKPVLPPPVAAAKLPAADPAAALPPPPARAAPPPVAVDESAGVRAVLARYETAYSRLDAAAASAVWPAVDRGALARAFRGLNSQRVTLGSCDVKVHGVAAQATCSGTATWEPRIGGGVRTEARRWDFELKKSGDAWRIERAIAQ